MSLLIRNTILSNIYTRKAITLHRNLSDPKGDYTLKFLNKALELNPNNSLAFQMRDDILFGRGELPPDRITF